MEATNISTPVLFITFARPEYARQSFDAIKKARPLNLYFYSNKARMNHPDEIMRNNTVRDLINEIDWHCNLKIFFRDEYVDVFTSVRSAIDWIFQNEEQAIILEEDCVASVSFFNYCDLLLLKYEQDLRIWIISGDNFVENQNFNNYSFFFTRNPHTHGWCSWRSRWTSLENDLNTLPRLIEGNYFKQLYSNKCEREFMLALYISLYKMENKPISWDYLLLYTMLLNGGIGIAPSKNLVSNIGIVGANNNRKGKHNLLPVFNGDIYNLDTIPNITIVDQKYDAWLFKHYHHDMSFYSMFLFVFSAKLQMYYPTLWKSLKKVKHIFK